MMHICACVTAATVSEEEDSCCYCKFIVALLLRVDLNQRAHVRLKQGPAGIRYIMNVYVMHTSMPAGPCFERMYAFRTNICTNKYMHGTLARRHTSMNIMLSWCVGMLLIIIYKIIHK